MPTVLARLLYLWQETVEPFSDCSLWKALEKQDYLTYVRKLENVLEIWGGRKTIKEVSSSVAYNCLLFKFLMNKEICSNSSRIWYWDWDSANCKNSGVLAYYTRSKKKKKKIVYIIIASSKFSPWVELKRVLLQVKIRDGTWWSWANVNNPMHFAIIYLL